MNHPELARDIMVSHRDVLRAELILRFTLVHPHCDTTIVSTCNHLHLAENLAAVAEGPLPSELHEQVASRIAALDN